MIFPDAPKASTRVIASMSLGLVLAGSVQPVRSLPLNNGVHLSVSAFVSSFFSSQAAGPRPRPIAKSSTPAPHNPRIMMVSPEMRLGIASQCKHRTTYSPDAESAFDADYADNTVGEIAQPRGFALDNTWVNHDKTRKVPGLS